MAKLSVSSKKYSAANRIHWVRRVLEGSGYSHTHVRRLVMETWRSASGGADDIQQPFGWLYTDLSKTLSPKEPAAVLRAVHLLHELTFEGPKLVCLAVSPSMRTHAFPKFIADFRKKLFILEDVKNTFVSAKYGGM